MLNDKQEHNKKRREEMPYLNGIYLSEENYDALGEIAKKEGKSRVQFAKALIEERVSKKKE